MVSTAAPKPAIVFITASETCRKDCQATRTTKRVVCNYNGPGGSEATEGFGEGHLDRPGVPRGSAGSGDSVAPIAPLPPGQLPTPLVLIRYHPPELTVVIVH
jgi:hypothetical protein